MATAIDYTEIENDFFTQVNNLRKDPTSFIPHLETLLKQFKNDILYRPGETPIQTTEGSAAVEESITFLKSLQPIPELVRSDFLDKAAKDHAKDIGTKGLVSHDGSDGSNVSDRIERYCEWEGVCAENLDFGSKTGLNCLLSLIVDDGVPTRGHRKNLLNVDCKQVGVGGFSHKEYEVCLVVNFVGSVREKDKPFFDYSNYKYQYPEDLTKKPEPKPMKIKNTYQLDDEDAPDDTVGLRVVKQTKLYNGKVHRVTKKFFTLSDGSTKIVEVEDV